MIQVRKVQDADIPQLEELFLDTRKKTFHWENPEKYQLEDFKKETEGEAVFVAVDDTQKIVGFISVWDKENPPFIHHLFVAPGHQRAGIGKLLISSLFSWLPLPYRLKCLARNRNARVFYLTNHWIEVERGISEEGTYLLLELRE